MKLSVSEARAQLTDLVRRAEAGEDVVLTVHGKAAARLVAVRQAARSPKRIAIEAIQASAAAKLVGEGTAATSQDFLYDEQGLPA